MPDPSSLIVNNSLPVVPSHILTVPSLPPVEIRLLSGLKVILPTAPMCPRRVCNGRPVATSQTLAVVSALAEPRSVPSGLNLTTYTTSV